MKYMYWCWGTWENIWCAYYFFSGIYKYGTNTGLSRLKTGSRKYGRDTPLPVSRPIFVFFCKYENERNKYRNTPLPAWSSSMGRGKKEKPLISTTSIQEKRFFLIPILGATTSDLHRRRHQFDCSSDFLPTADRNFCLLLFTTSTTR